MDEYSEYVSENAFKFQYISFNPVKSKDRKWQSYRR